MATIETVARDIQALISESEIDYVPDYELKDFKSERVVIVPVGIQYSNLTRGTKEVLVTIEIGICKRIKESELPVMLNRTEDITNTLLNAQLVNARGYIKEVINNPAYDVQSMVSNGTFLTVLQVQVRVI